MAKIEITYEDNPDQHGLVITKCIPDAKTLFAKWKRGESMTPAESMALVTLSSAIRASAQGEIRDKMDGKNIIIVPN